MKCKNKKNSKILAQHYISTNSPSSSEWKRILCNGHDSGLEINRNGVVRFQDSHNIYPHRCIERYRAIDFSVGKDRFTICIHRIVACIFIPIPTKYSSKGYNQLSLFPVHVNNDTLNNSTNNITWMTSEELTKKLNVK